MTTVAQPQQNPVASVTLVYLLGYGAETAVPMRGECGTQDLACPCNAILCTASFFVC